ncbi:MAG: hypothetical protein JWO22_528 [Frankiales bacterium]|nr:hypothetical protein [Frankiales bacterium]
MLSAGPLRDPDVFWHIRAGAYHLHGHSFPYPDPWAYTRPTVHWHATAWLSEVVLAAVDDVAGLRGVQLLRAMLVLAVCLAVARQVSRRAGGPAAPLVLGLALVPLSSYMQERPQTASLLFVVWLAGVAHDYLSRGQLPRWLPLLGLTWLWAWVHGLFVLVPAVLLVLAAAAVLDRRRAGFNDVVPLAVRAVAALFVAAATPVGPALLLSSLTVGSAAKGIISEWEPTTFVIHSTWGFAALVLVVLLCWARRGSVPRAEVLYVLFAIGFGLLAYRNTGPATLLLVPVAVTRLADEMPSGGLAVPRLAVAALAALAPVVAVAQYVQQPLLPSTTPRAIAQQLARQPEPLRLLNDYNLSGYLIYTDGKAVRLVVDGRAERYGHAFLHDYDLATRGDASWRVFLEQYDPQAALLPADGPLAQLMTGVARWRVVTRDHGWALLAPPGGSLAP